MANYKKEIMSINIASPDAYDKLSQYVDMYEFMCITQSRHTAEVREALDYKATNVLLVHKMPISPN